MGSMGSTKISCLYTSQELVVTLFPRTFSQKNEKNQIKKDSLKTLGRKLFSV